MARYKPYDYDQMQMIPISLSKQLTPGTLEYAIQHVIEERINMSLFDKHYRNDKIGRSAIDPRILLKVVLLGYSRGMISSRSLERACKENVTFMALTCGQQFDHSTIAAFISSMDKEISTVFTQVLLVCEQEGLLGGTHFSLDGVKLPSNASKESSGTFNDLLKKQKNIEKKVKEAIREHRAIDKQEGQDRSDTDRTRSNKRIKRLKQQAERIERFLATNEPKEGARGKEIQSNVTDSESAKMATSHGVIQGYNANAVVDEKQQVVVHAEAFGRGGDSENMKPLLDGTKDKLKAIGMPLKDKKISADSSYYSVKNLEVCRDHQVDAYIPDRGFRKRDERFSDAGRHRRSVDRKKERYKSKRRWFGPGDFTMDDRSGKLVCPAGKELYVKNRNFEVDGRRAIAYKAPKAACTGCKLRSKCLRNPDTVARQVYMFYGRRPGSITDEMKQKIDTAEGRAVYAKRLAIVEPVFGNLRAQKRLDRFTLRGKTKVGIQWMLYCMVHNIEKIANFGMNYATAV